MLVDLGFLVLNLLKGLHAFDFELFDAVFYTFNVQFELLLDAYVLSNVAFKFLYDGFVNRRTWLVLHLTHAGACL